MTLWRARLRLLLAFTKLVDGGPPSRRDRRLAVACAVALHVLILVAMIRAAPTRSTAAAPAGSEKTAWLVLVRRSEEPVSPPRKSWPRPHGPAPAPRTRLSRGTRALRPAGARPAPPVEATSPTWALQVPPAPQPPASAASAPPLNLTLPPGALRAIAGSRGPSLAQAADAQIHAPSDDLVDDGEKLVERNLGNGVREVHVHGGCFRMVPSARSQADPFNHGGEEIATPCR